MAALLMASVYVGLPLGVLVIIRADTGAAAIAWLIAVIAIERHRAVLRGHHVRAPQAGARGQSGQDD